MKTISLMIDTLPIGKVATMLENVLRAGMPETISHANQRKHLQIGFAIDRAVGEKGGLLEVTEQQWGKVIELWTAAKLPVLVAEERKVWQFLDQLICEDEPDGLQQD